MKPIETDSLPEMVNNDKLRHLLEIAVNTTTDGVALLNADSEYYYLNRAHVEQFGYSDESELLGKTWHVFYGHDEINRIERDIFPLLLKNGNWKGETIGKKKDGSPIHQEITLTFLEDGGLICVTRILDEIRKAEKQLEASYNSLKNIINHSTSGITLENADRVVIESNDTAVALLGLDPKEFSLIGESSYSNLEAYSKMFKKPKQWTERMNQVYVECNPVFNEVVQLADGSYIERDFIPIYADHGIQGYLWILRDVTERESTTRRLKNLVSREKELNEMRSKLVRTISHEFKKPILNTLTGIQLLQGQLKNSGEGLYARALEHIVLELQGLSESVSKLVKYEALYDRSETAMKPVTVKNLVTNYLHYHFNLFMLSEKFEIQEAADDEIILLDLDLFNLALKNVIENALKYSEHNERIKILTVAENGKIRLSFSNPIKSKNRPDTRQLGTPLYRADPGDKKGLGLGLGIVQHIIDLLGGFVKYAVTKDTYSISLVFPIRKSEPNDQ